MGSPSGELLVGPSETAEEVAELKTQVASLETILREQLEEARQTREEMRKSNEALQARLGRMEDALAFQSQLKMAEANAPPGVKYDA